MPLAWAARISARRNPNVIRPAGGPQREPRRPDAQPERGRVDQHVRGVREQRERVGDERDRDLRDHEADDQRERDGERADLGLGRDAVVVIVLAPRPSLTSE